MFVLAEFPVYSTTAKRTVLDNSSKLTSRIDDYDDAKDPFSETREDCAAVEERHSSRDNHQNIKAMTTPAQNAPRRESPADSPRESPSRSVTLSSSTQHRMETRRVNPMTNTNPFGDAEYKDDVSSGTNQQNAHPTNPFGDNFD